jgi:hypothetical protein
MHTTCRVRACARAYLRVCTLREHRMRVAHTCRLPPSGALLSSIYLKCDSVVKCETPGKELLGHFRVCIQ